VLLATCPIPWSRRAALSLACASIACGVGAAPAESRSLTPDDYYNLVDVANPRLSPDGSAVAYVVSTNDRVSDSAKSAIWWVSWDGHERRALTQGESATDPQWSPDGRYLSFLSARPADSEVQVWLLDLHGGEARQLTHTTGEIASYAWSPDGKHLILSVSKAEPDAHLEPGTHAEPATHKPPSPIVIDGYRFKADIEGYLTGASKAHLSLVDVATGADTALTSDPQAEDLDPVWAPDGKTIAYVSNHSPDAERSGEDEIYLIEARAGAVPRRLATTYSPNTRRLVFSPDGRFICFRQGREPRYAAYIADRLALVSVSDGSIRPLTDSLDRQASHAAFNTDGSAIVFDVEDRGGVYLAELNLGTGKITRLTSGSTTILDSSAAAGHVVLLGTSDAHPPELLALEGGALRPLTTHNDALMAGLSLGVVEDIVFKSRDGTDVQGQLFKPPGYVAGRRYPTILWIHGGPEGQDQHELIPEGYSPSLERRLFAAQGYVVLAVNYRGSSGRGQQFQQSILADWGHKEVEDLLAGVDYAIAKGFADPGKLGIGGWSYGGILTDYSIASDPRFKAAISGAGSANQISMYGHDEYILQYNAEIGPPWKNTARWLALSYPFFHADRIHTPTLFMGGDKDFNVPIVGGEQMYMALRTLGVPTELVVYPGEFHVFTRPSFIADRAERYIAWFAKYLENP
jgi:dipeptidyl aminopeptidase/acylaminoacyl peptidase